MYSYDQYHWWPEIFTVILGDLESSIIYNVFKEGKAMKINITAGKIVHKISITCLSTVNLLNIFDNVKEINRYKEKITIIITITIEWSWKNKICSIVGEAQSWKDK